MLGPGVPGGLGKTQRFLNFLGFPAGPAENNFEAYSFVFAGSGLT